MLRIPKKNYDDLLREAENAYPDECCGLLIGNTSGDEKNVDKIQPITNINTVRAKDRYEMDPKEMEKADERARKESKEIVGIYHSHPDHPSRPSEFDRQRAWPVYSYLIVAVENGRDFQSQSWVLEDWEGEFQEETLELPD
jgi:proteasome lid subunit RPN8/RPN11